MRWARDYAAGRYAPSAPAEEDVVIVPRTWAYDGSLAGVVYCHGRSGSAHDIDQPVGQRAGTYAIAHAVGSVWPLVSADLAGQGTWGHPSTQQARIGDAIAYLRSSLGCSDAPVGIVGTSMGGLGGLLYAMSHPDDVACVAGVTPVIDLDNVRQSGFASAEINAVWGVANNGAPLPAGANPATRTADLLAPFWCWYSSGDAIVAPSTVTTFATAVGGTAVLVGSMDHEDVAAAIPPADVVEFLSAHLT